MEGVLTLILTGIFKCNHLLRIHSNGHGLHLLIEFEGHMRPHNLNFRMYLHERS